MKPTYTILLFLALSLTVKAQDSLNVSLLYHWEDQNLPASWQWNNVYNEVWGVVVDGREYAIIGSTMGTHIFDVTDPVNSYEADFVPGAHQGVDIVHRDYHDYDGYLYAVADEGQSTLQIMDLSYLPDSVSVVYDSDALLVRSHNIFIDSANARLYACGVSNITISSAAIEVYDISNPAVPVELASITNFPYYHDVYVRDNIAIGNNGLDGLTIVDFTDPVNYTLEGTLLNYPDRDYNHAGWADDEMEYYYLTDENYGMSIKALDITDFTDINVVDTFTSETDPGNVPHNCLVKDDYLHVSYYHDGYYVFDISDRENPVIAGYYDTYMTPGYNSFEGNWGVYPFLPSGIVVASDMQTGLYIFDASVALGIGGTTKPQRVDAFKIGPNPFADKVYLQSLGTETGDFNVSVVDIQGKEVVSTMISSVAGQRTIVEIPYDLQSGIYFIKISNDRYLQVAKISKTVR